MSEPLNDAAGTTERDPIGTAAPDSTSAARPAGDQEAVSSSGAVSDSTPAPGVDRGSPAASSPLGASDPADLIDVECFAPLRAEAARLDERFASGLVATLREGVERHREIIAASKLEQAPPEEWEPRANTLLEYRKVVGKSFLQPMVEVVSQRGAAAAIVDGCSTALDESVARARELPETCTAAWPDGGLVPRATDSRGRRFGKFFARGVSAARKAGTDRELPLRATALHHLQHVVAPTLDRAVQQSLVQWADWFRELELAWVEWGDAALIALLEAELPQHEEYGEIWVSVREAALRLQGRLEALVDSAPSLGGEGIVSAHLAPTHGHLLADLAVAGSFLYSPSESDFKAPSLVKSNRAGATYVAWEAAVADKMRMYGALLSILSGATGVQRRLLARFRSQCMNPVQGLLPIADALEGIVEQLAPTMTPARLSQLDARVSEALAPLASTVPDASAVDETVRSGSDSTVEALVAMVRQAPGELELLADTSKLPIAGRKPETRSVPLQELARQSFDALRIERIRASTSGLVESVDRLRDNVAALGEVFSFAHAAAVAELEGDAEAEAEIQLDETGGDATTVGDDEASADDGRAGERAMELVSEALESTAESLRHEVRSLDQALEDAQARLATEISEGAMGLVERLAAGRMQAQLLAASSRVADVRAWINERWGPPVDRAVRRVVHVWKVVVAFATRGLRRGSEIVGGASGERAASTHAVKTLADAKEFIQQLPLVYQRLFSLEPLTDPALLVGREAEMADAMSRWRQWRHDDGVPLVLHGRQGSGITSFLNALCSAMEEDGATLVRVGIGRRMTKEPTLANAIATAVGLEPVDSLTDLAAAVLGAPPGALPDAVAIDNLEHLFLRVPGGTLLLDRLLTFMAETEPRVFWIGGVTSSAWQIFAVAEPTAISQVDVLDLRPLGPAETKAAILKRHRRSGLTLRYEEPQTGRRMFRRRLRRMRDREAHQTAVETDFFEQLDRSSSGTLRLALFQWLRSADFESGDGLLMRPAKKPDFAVLEALSVTQNFTLKAFLEHRTLTLSEHDRIFRLTTHDSYQIFESLENRHLITAASGGGRRATRSDIEADTRYHVPPLLTGAVMAHLQSRNIVH